MESKWLTGVTPAVTSILGNGSTIFIWNLGSLWPRDCNNTISLVMRGPCIFCHESATLKWKCRHFLPRMSFFVLQRFIDHSGLISDRETHAAFPCYSMPKQFVVQSVEKAAKFHHTLPPIPQRCTLKHVSNECLCQHPVDSNLLTTFINTLVNANSEIAKV